jgi:hypothetical protein
VAIRITRTGNLDQLSKLDVKDILPTEGDLLYGLQRQKSRILSRTERGVDANGRPLAAYSTKRPYYYYPNGPVGRSRTTDRLKRDQAGVKRFASKVGRTSRAVTRSGLGLRFPSYAAFKLTYLGRSNVDLTGPRAPHMLQAIQTTVGNSQVTGDERVGLNDRTTPAFEGSIGIYGEPGKRAYYNNTGTTRGLPQRQFFASTNDDTHRFGDDLKQRVKDRLRQKFGFADMGSGF